jgi:hypothetical protein
MRAFRQTSERDWLEAPWLANPPFGKKSSVTIVNEAGEQSKESLIINRDDCPLKRSRRVAKSKSRLRASRAAN